MKTKIISILKSPWWAVITLFLVGIAIVQEIQIRELWQLKIIPEYQKLLVAYLTGIIATIIGLYVSLDLAGRDKREDGKLKLKGVLIPMWYELRAARHQLLVIKDNFWFEELLQLGRTDLDSFLKALLSKFTVLQNYSDSISTETYRSAQQSGSLMWLKDTGKLSQLYTSYESLNNFIVFLRFINAAFKHRASLTNLSNNKAALAGLDLLQMQAYRDSVVRETADKIIKITQDIDTAIDEVTKGIAVCSSELEILGTGTIEEETPYMTPEQVLTQSN